MELLIPGLILVGLMVYASTRIKKTAAKAFEAETVETDDFTIDKPDGLLVVLGGDPKYLFESYSREYGTDGFENKRQVTAYLTATPNLSTEQVIKSIRADEKIVSDTSEVVGDYRYKVLEGTRSVNSGQIRTFHKLAEKGGRVYRFDAELLAPASEGMSEKVDSLISSFHLK